jgi:rfaE bifunctional protein kinase chain/domain
MNIGVFGDIILDVYITGSTSRISPEAPVPIIRKEREFATLGGAANVASNLKKLQNNITLYGAVGNDDRGREVEKLCSDLGIDTRINISSHIPTTTKSRIISRNQQMLRIDDELFLKSSVEVIKDINFDTIASFDIIAISDYAKGYISEAILEKILHHKNPNTKVIIDPKGKDWEKYNGAFLVKPNLSELEIILNTSITNTDAQVEETGKEVLNEFHIENLLITRGSKGMTLINEDGCHHFPTKAVDVYDVSGAGDTSLAVLIDCLAKDISLHQSIKIANIASSYVVTKPMTYAISREELDQLLA